MEPKTKRNILRPITMIKRYLNKIKRKIRTPKEIVEMRDDLHKNFIIHDRTGNNIEALECKYKEEILNWVLKENGTV